MNFEWVNLSNPVALWWIFLVSASVVNITLWSWVRIYKFKNISFKNFRFWELNPENIIWFSGLYVFGCAYRSFFVKADVQRICVLDTWFSSVFLGRTIATIAELAFVIQWAVVLKALAQSVDDKVVLKISRAIIVLILIAECFSWFAVISTNYLGNSIEESLWAITSSLIFIALFRLKKYFKAAFNYAIRLALIFDIVYILFMIFVDIRMYITRYLEALQNNQKYFGLMEGLFDLNHRWVVTHDIEVWKTEIPWITLYFSFAVMISIGLCLIPLKIHHIKNYHA